MSRCFPFPPPGYEKEARTKDVDLLRKEKHREKKHKRERKDKEKRESKERSDKDRNDEKQRDKKDKKDRNRDKKKDREKDKERDKEKDGNKNKDKTSTSEEKKLPGGTPNHDAEKLLEKENKGKKNSLPDEKKPAGVSASHIADKLNQKNHLGEENKSSRLVPEAGRKIKEDGSGKVGILGLPAVAKFSVSQAKRNDRIVAAAPQGSNNCDEVKEDSSSKKIEGHEVRNEERFSGNVKARVEGMSKQFDKTAESRKDPNEKVQERRDEKRGERLNSKDGEKKGPIKEKDRDKEKRKEEKVRHKIEPRSAEIDGLKDSGNGNPVGVQTIKSFGLSAERNEHPPKEGHSLKREFDGNGFLPANDVKPTKLPRPTPSNSSTENGQILEAQKASALTAPERQGATNNHKLDSKERKINGIIGANPATSSMKNVSTSEEAAQLTIAPKKPPHPDSKLLSQVYSVPKVEEWSDFDDQSWLFDSSGSRSKKPKLESSQIEETPQIWAQAMHIESADVIALPYVIPY